MIVRRLLFLPLLFLAAAQGVANAQEREVTVSDVHNSGCMAYTRGEEASNLPTIVIKKDGADVLVELQNYENNCGTTGFNVTTSIEKGWSGASYSDSVFVSVMPIVPYEADCTCPFNVSFKLQGLESDKFYLTCWWFDGLVELTGSEPVVVENVSEEVLIDESRYLLKKTIRQAFLVACNPSLTGEARIPQEISCQDEQYNVTGINYEAFMSNPSVKKIVIPSTVKTLGYGISGGNYVNPFNYCKSLESIEVEAGNAAVQSVDGVMFDRKMGALLAYPAGSDRQSYEVPEGVTTLENYCLANSTHLMTITLPDGLKSIDAQAFAGCSSLKTLDIPESVNKIELFAFNGTAMAELYIRGVIDPEYMTTGSNPFEPMTMFSGMSTQTKLYVLPDEVDKFKAIYGGPVFPLPSSGETTGIESMNNVQCTMNNVLFDLQGRRIQGSPKHGVYIQNGKKVMR